MKKLLLSLGALCLATTLFTIQNLKIDKNKASQDTIARVEKVFQG